ncbi:hypothetical protein [Arthrobacter sp. Leaf69]|uniref:hypothetical protein n=1 Tax=Arthrobacter sp. Leaf69 TaxID=1736232 RepID=UPI0006F6F8C6|nr:hypothetical protein [Arthrobacter sp. Leaf69]KQN88564.1 hypothetical protein ASE96_08990 [Arthrobacter sp. Leaf69]
MSPSSALPGLLRRALAALCAVAVLSVFVAPAPAAIANEPVAQSEPAAAAASVTLEGDPVVFGSLTARFSPAAPAGGLRYEYLRDGDPIPYPYLGPYSSFRPQPEDFGARISVRVTATVDGHDPVVITSAKTAPVIGRLEVSAAASGEPIVGKSISYSVFLSGLPTLQVPVARTYAWYRDGEPIPGATAGQYTVTDEDFGRSLTAAAEFTAPGYRPVSDTVAFAPPSTAT